VTTSDTITTAGAPAEDRGDQRDEEGGVEPGQGRNMGDEGKGDGLRHHRECHRQAAEDIGLHLLGA